MRHNGGMPRHCGVCLHPERDQINRALLFGPQSLSALGRQYKLSRDALRAHRTNHLDAFVAAERAAPDAWTLPQVYAEAERLLAISWDVLADAQRGKVVGVDAQGQPVRKVSSGEVSMLLGAVRQNIDLLVRIKNEPRNREKALARGMHNATRPSPRRGTNLGKSRGGPGIHR